MEDWFNTVETALRNRPEVVDVFGHPVEETNKVLSVGFVGGNFLKKFTLELDAAQTPDPWELDSLAATLESDLQSSLLGLLTADDQPHRALFISTDGHGEDRTIVAKAYFIPNPE